MKKKSRYLVSVGLLLALAVFSACGSGETSNTNASNANTATAGGANSTTPAAAKKEASPLTISPTELLADSASGDKYKDRVLTVTGVLMEIDPGEYVKVGEKGKKDYVKCEGSFGDYARERFEIRMLEEKGKTMTGTVKGTFSEFKTDGGAKVAVLTSCTLSDVKK